MSGEKLKKIKIFLALAALLLAGLGLWGCGGDQEPAGSNPDPSAESAAPAPSSDSRGAPQEESKPAAIPAHSGERNYFEYDSSFRIALVTPSDHQGEESLSGVRTVIERYGSVEDGGLIKHLVFPDNFIVRLEQTIDLIASAADDPEVKVVVVIEGVPGTAEAFAKMRAKRQDLILLVAESHEDVATIAETADLVVNSDFISRGYLMAWSAREMGAKSLVHVSFPRHMVDQSLARRRAIMEVAAGDLGLEFYTVTVPDPADDAGVAAAREHIAESFPAWLESYGADTAFVTTSDGLAPVIIQGVVEHGGYFVEADESSPTLGYPEVLGVDPTPMGSDWPKLLEALSEAAVAKGAGGRLGTWTASLHYAHLTSLVEIGRLAATGAGSVHDDALLARLYADSSPTAPWKMETYADAAFELIHNVRLAYQDTYVLGRGYLGADKVEIDPKYKAIAMFGGEAQSPPFHIAIVTGDSSQGEDDLLGAEETVRRYGAAKDGGLIRHLQYSDLGLDHPEMIVGLLESLLADPLLKVVVVNQAGPGTSEGFRRIKAAKPHILCLAGEFHEDVAEIASSADLILGSDFITRGYIIPWAAKEMGADTLVHVSFARHMRNDAIALRAKIMEAAAGDLGMRFAHEVVPDPVNGLDAAVDFVNDSYPGWLEKYGTKAAFFITNDAQTVPLIRQVARLGGYFVTADIPSTLLGYPDAFDLDLMNKLGDWKGIQDIIEEAVIEAGGAGRMGVWTVPMGYATSEGLVEFGKLLAEGAVQIADMDSFLASMGRRFPGIGWNGSFLNDFVSGKPLRNFFLIYQDVYVFGKGYIHTTQVPIPDKYYEIRLD